MKKALLEFRGGSKGDLLVAHFNNVILPEQFNKTGLYDKTNIRTIEFLLKIDAISNSNMLQKDLINALIDNPVKLTSVHSLKKIFSEQNIDILTKNLNIIQLYVEENFYNQVSIDFSIKNLCKKCNTDKLFYRKKLYEKFGSAYKNYKLEYEIDWRMILENIEINDENRIIFLKNFIYKLISEKNKNFRPIEKKYIIVHYSKLFFEPYEDYYKLCDILNFEPKIKDFIVRVKNSYIQNPVIFANTTIDLTEFGYQYYN